MKLKEALELADECGLSTVGEAILNVELHAPSLFPYEKMHDELNELCQEAAVYDDNQLISDALKGLAHDSQ